MLCDAVPVAFLVHTPGPGLASWLTGFAGVAMSNLDAGTVSTACAIAGNGKDPSVMGTATVPAALGCGGQVGPAKKISAQMIAANPSRLTFMVTSFSHEKEPAVCLRRGLDRPITMASLSQHLPDTLAPLRRRTVVVIVPRRSAESRHNGMALYNDRTRPGCMAGQGRMRRVGQEMIVG
jgi:hypothetical protein